MKNKKITAFLLTAAMLLSGCDNSNTAPETSDSSDITPQAGMEETSHATEQTEYQSYEATATPQPEVSTGVITEVPETKQTTTMPEEATVEITSEPLPPEVTTKVPNVSNVTTADNTPPMETEATTVPLKTDVPSTGPVELTPDSDSGETLVINLDSGKIGSMRHYTEYVGNGSDSAFELNSSVYMEKMAGILNGLLYVEEDPEEKEQQELSYQEWLEDNDGDIQPETLVILDKSGNELIRLYSDARTAIPSGAPVHPFARAKTGGKEYKLFYGSLDYRMVQETLLNQRLVAEGFFFLEVYEQVAKTAAGDQLNEFTSDPPIFRVHSPEKTLIGTDGQVIYPDALQGSTLVDCTFTYPDGSVFTVVMDAKDAKIYEAAAIR